jgi:hypothetical protein
MPNSNNKGAVHLAEDICNIQLQKDNETEQGILGQLAQTIFSYNKKC